LKPQEESKDHTRIITLVGDVLMRLFSTSFSL